MMADQAKTTESRPVHAVQLAVISSGDTGMIPAQGIEAKTVGVHMPNFVVTAVSPVRAILIRFINAYLTMMVGLVMAGMASDVIPAEDFLHLLIACAKLSVAAAGVGFLKDCVTIFGRLESKYPLTTGSI
jgi:hypothetical protein